jgi:hypothetical protein
MTIYTPRDSNIAEIKSIEGDFALCQLPGARRLIACHVSQAGIPRWMPSNVGQMLHYDHIDMRDRRQLIGAHLTPEGNRAINS